MKRVGLIGWRGMVGSVLMQRMREEKDFDVINSQSTSVEQKIEAFSPSNRKKWLRGYIYNDQGQVIGGSSIADRTKGIKKFTEEWFKIGIIVCCTLLIIYMSF